MSEETAPTCSQCGDASRMAIRTTRPNRDTLKSTVYWDDRTAPKSATRYCASHGEQCLIELTRVLVS